MKTKSRIISINWYLETLIVLIFSCFISVAYAVEAGSSADDMLIDDLLLELEQVTEIATRTKLNVDYVPGMVTVLHGEDLRKAGLLTFEEALQTVPGVEFTISNSGKQTFVMRGIGKSFVSGKVKVLVNGRATNVTMNGISSATEIPMELVDRIEIIRGPGSAIYGEFAYAGVVNIILRKDSHFFYSGSQQNKHTVGGVLSNEKSEDAVKYALSFSAYQGQGKEVTSGEDYLKVEGFPSNSPGYSNEVEKILTSSLQMSYKNMSWETYFQNQKIGDYFGFQKALPPAVETTSTFTSATSDADMKFMLSENLAGVVSAGGRFYALRGSEHTFLPANFPDATTKTCPTCLPTAFFTDGVLGSPNYTEYEAHGNMELNFNGINNHEMLLGLNATYIKQGDTWARRNYEIAGQTIKIAPLQNYRGDENWLNESNTRKIASIYAQDQISLMEPLTVTIGARFDDYIGIGQSFNPRIAAVYNLFDKHIFKFQLSNAFRPPTFLEMFAKNNIVAVGNVDINPETIKSIELGYIFNSASQNTNFRITTFQSELSDLITNDDTTAKYQNKDSVMSKGVEVEVTKKLFRHFLVRANGTFLKVTDNESGRKLPNVASLLGNFSVLYRLNSSYTLMLTDQYTGKRNREVGDSRKPTDDYHIVNMSLSLEDIIMKKITLNVGIKNLLNTSIVHPSELVNFKSKLLPAYANDYPRPGREIWLNATFKY